MTPAVLREYPVRFALLFGSHARVTARPDSDVDVAVVFEDLEPGDPTYNDVRFDLEAALDAALVSAVVDLVDVRSVSPAVARQILEEGSVLVGSKASVNELEATLDLDSDGGPSPRERFDAALERVDNHLA